VLESVLRSRGYQVINATPSVPTNTILKYIGDKDPDLIMVSVTLSDNIGAAKRLIRKISEEFNNIPIIVGGSAFIDFKGDIPGVIAVCPPDNSSLDDVMRYVKSSLSTHVKNS
jgi:methylmalonyl-CoA mutase cobalamin-binding subunit